MHMSDALLSPAVGCCMYAASAGAMAYSVKRLQPEELGRQRLPLMAVSGAFVFAAQMINFTIPGTGSSGHIGGGVLLAGLLGGPAALLTLAAVLIVQCLFFADGGLLALGANIFNMGVIPCMIIWPLLFRPLLRRGLSRRNLTVACVLSAVVGLELGAFAVVLETLASGVTELPFTVFAGLMLPIHLAIGLVEGVITAGVLLYVYRVRPELLQESAGVSGSSGGSWKAVIITLAILALLVGGGLSHFASSHPDGLEWSMERTAGTSELEREDGVHAAAAEAQERTALLPDYDFPAGEGTGTTVSGLAGAGMVCVLAAAAGGAIHLAKSRRKQHG